MDPPHEREVANRDAQFAHALVHQLEPNPQQSALSVLVAHSSQVLLDALGLVLERRVLARLEHRLNFDGGHPGVANILG